MIKRLNTLSLQSQIILLVVVTVSLRLALAWIFGIEVADLVQYHWMADIIDRGENIYKTTGLFHYSPIPMFLPAWSLHLAQAIGLPFHFVVKWPMILADTGIALLLWWQSQKRGLQSVALWIGLGYAFNPVSLLTTSFHGSYSVLPAFFTLLAYCVVIFLPLKRYYYLSALSLGMAIGLRGYPVLFVPYFLRKIKLDWRGKTAFLILAGLPSAITLLPFLIVNFQSVWQGVFSYNGVTDYGWIASIRAYWLVTTGNLYLPGTLATDLLSFSKLLFLAAYVLITIFFWLKHERFSLLSGILIVTLLFFGVYGGISSQYLVWAIPFAMLEGSAWGTAYTWSATASLVSFYLFYFPAILFGQLPIAWREMNPPVMTFNLVFNTAFWGICMAWLIRLLIHPTPDIAIQTNDTLPGSKESKPPLSRSHILVLLAEIALIIYIGLVFVLEINLITHPHVQTLQVDTVWSVGRTGSGLGEISSPLGLAVDEAGNIYLADRGNHRVEQFSPDGKAIKTWTGDSVNQIPFMEPSDIAIDPNSGNILVLDSGNGWIYRLGADGNMEAAINGAELEMYNPRGLAINSSGDIFVADTGSGRIIHLDPQGNVIAIWDESGQLGDPTGITVRDNDLFVADVNNQRIIHYKLDGKRVGTFKIDAGSRWIDSDSLEHIYINNPQTQKISVYDFSGKFISDLNPEKEIPPIDGLAGIAITQDGQLYVVGSSQLFHFKIEWK